MGADIRILDNSTFTFYFSRTSAESYKSIPTVSTPHDIMNPKFHNQATPDRQATHRTTTTSKPQHYEPYVNAPTK